MYEYEYVNVRRARRRGEAMRCEKGTAAERAVSSGPNPAAERALELRGDRNGEAVAVFAAHHLH